MLRQYKELEPQLHDAEQQRAIIEREISQLQSWMAGDEHEAKITQFPSERKRYSERVEDYKRRIESFEEKLPALFDRIHGLSQELETLERQFLNP